MTRRQGRWLAMGGVALVTWAILGLLTRGSETSSRAGLANAAALLLATGLALASTGRAARHSRDSERMFWALLAAAAAVAGVSQALASTGILGRAFWQQPVPLVVGAYLPTALSVAALLMRPHRSQGTPIAVTALDGLLVATGAAFLISYGLLVPQPRAARALHLAADSLPLVLSLVLAFTARDAAYRRVYRLVAAGFAVHTIAGALRVVWLPGGWSWTAPYASWAPVLVFLAVAGLEPAEGVWIASSRREWGHHSLGRVSVFLVALPPVVDGILRTWSEAGAGVSVRSQLALAATVLLALLASARESLAAAVGRTGETASPVPDDEESRRFLTFAAGVAHQVNNRLNVVAGWTQVAKRRGEGEPAALEALLAAVREASEAAGQFQRLAAMRRDTEGS